MTYYDWGVTALLMAFLLGAAFYSKSKTKGVADFIVAGRKVRKWLGMSTMEASGTGIITIAYMGQEGFTKGFSFYWISLVGGVVSIVLYGVYGFGIERFRATKAMTAAQYHEMRYSKGVRLLVGIVMGIGGVLNMAVFPAIGANFLVHYLSLPEEFVFLGTQLTTATVLVGGLLFLAVFFTFLGGQVTVVLTDYIQAVSMALGFFVIMILVIKDVGVRPVFEQVYELKGEAAFNPLLEGSYGWVWVAWFLTSIFLSPFSFGVVLSRLARAASPKVTRQITLISTAFSQGRILMYLFLGSVAFLLFGDTVPADVAGNLTNEEFQRVALGIFLGRTAPMVVMGLMLAVFLFAEISTDDSYILTWASVIVNDVVCVCLKKPLSTKAHLRLLKVVVILIAIFIFFWGVMYKPSESILNYLTLTGTIWLGGGIAMVFGLYRKRACTAGAYAAVLSCLIIPLTDMTLRQILTPEVYHVKHEHAGLLAIGLGIALLVIISLLTKKETKYVDYGKVVKQSEIND